MSQNRLAQLAAEPVSTIGRLERGLVSPTVQMLLRLAATMRREVSVVLASSLLVRVRAQVPEVERICARHGARDPRVFGSTARREEDLVSDLDRPAFRTSRTGFG